MTTNAEKLAALDALVTAAEQLNEVWARDGYADFLDAGYPKCLPSFDEFVLEVGAWFDAAREAERKSRAFPLHLSLTEDEAQHLVEAVFVAAEANLNNDDVAMERLTASVYQKVLAASRAAGYEPTGYNGPLERTLPPVGARVRLTGNVERYPHFIAKAGSTGIVTCADPDGYRVRLNDHLPGAEEWDNEVIWTADDNPMDDLAVIVKGGVCEVCGEIREMTNDETALCQECEMKGD